jgi:hypothetical protein
MDELKIEIDPWPLPEPLKWPGHERLYRSLPNPDGWCNEPYWCYFSSIPGSNFKLPRPSIDQELELKKEKEKELLINKTGKR